MAASSSTQPLDNTIKPVNVMDDSSQPENVQMCGTCIAQMPPVVACILSYLPMKDLNICIRVCKLWLKIGSTVKKKRKQIFWYCQLLIDHDAGIPKSEFAKIDDQCSPLEQSLSLQNQSDLVASLTRALQEAKSEPKLALMFVNQRISHFFKASISKRRKLSTLSDRLVSLLPKTCLGLGALSHHGVIGTVDGGQLVEAEVVDGISALFIPDLPEVQFHPFLLGKGHRNIKINEINDELLSKITNIKSDETIKCLLLFSSDYCGKHTDLLSALTSRLLSRQPDGFAVGGGYLENIVALQGLCGVDFEKPIERSKVETLGIAITGNNVEAASVISDGEIDSVKTSLQNLKSCELDEKNLIGLMFSCCCRGKDFYLKANVEADLFREVFPNTPLFGFFGSGEIGVQKLDDKSCVKRPKVELNDIDMIHSYTTVFVLLSFKM